MLDVRFFRRIQQRLCLLTFSKEAVASAQRQQSEQPNDFRSRLTGHGCAESNHRIRICLCRLWSANRLSHSNTWASSSDRPQVSDVFPLRRIRKAGLWFDCACVSNDQALQGQGFFTWLTVRATNASVMQVVISRWLYHKYECRC